MTFSLKCVKKALPTYGSKVDKLNRVWKGEYDGYSGYDVVRRDYVLNISSYNHKTKEIKGTAYIKPSKKAAAYDGMNGSYKFSGTFDDQTGLITLQGHTWIQYPVGEYYLDFEFVKLAGYIDNTGSRITGMSQDGIWKMHAEKKSGLFGNAKTSQGYRYPKAYKKTQAAYPALANLTSVATYGMPGVVKSSSMVGVATDMVPLLGHLRAVEIHRQAVEDLGNVRRQPRGRHRLRWQLRVRGTQYAVRGGGHRLLHY